MPNIIAEYLKQENGYEIAVITLSRPKQLNALNLETIAELDFQMTEMKTNTALRCVIITGAGERAFGAGADTRELASLDAKGALEHSNAGNRVMQKIQCFPCPVIAAVNGYALGGGCELALACDIRIASENAVFGLPETSLGIFPGWGGTQRLARLTGYGKAAELIFTAGRLNAVQAKENGLANCIVPAAQLMDAAVKMAGKIAGNAPLAVKSAKQAMQIGLDGSLMDGLQVESHKFAALFHTADTKDGLDAFNSKTSYQYTGK